MSIRRFSALVGAVLCVVLASGPAQSQDSAVKIALIGAVTGPISAMAPAMMDAKQLAVKHVNEQGGIGKGRKLEVVLGDSACNPQNATDALNRAINIERVIGVVGPHCSGGVLAAAQSVSVPAGVLMITPSGTSPEISKVSDKDLLFRTVPSDAYQGQALARTLHARGTRNVAVAYLNNDYGRGLAQAFRSEFENLGGKISGYSGHEEGRASYRSDLANLARQGADTLVIFDYGDGTGLTVLRQALENGFFENFVGADGMRSEALIREIGSSNLDTFLVSAPVGGGTRGLELFNEQFAESGGNPDATFATTSYDAAFLMALAVEKAGADRGKLADALRAVTASSGEVILPGEWAKAKKLIAEGKDIRYSGAAGDHAFDDKGDVAGTFALFRVKGDTYERITEMK